VLPRVIARAVSYDEAARAISHGVVERERPAHTWLTTRDPSHIVSDTIGYVGLQSTERRARRPDNVARGGIASTISRRDVDRVVDQHVARSVAPSRGG